MNKKRTMQIDVKGLYQNDNHVMDCRLYVGGRCITIYMTKSNYEALMYDGVFIRDGKSEDSAGVINTTNTFVENDT